MRNMKFIFLSFMIFSAYKMSIAQEALWQLNFDKEVQWSKITETGVLLIGTQDMMMYGIDSRDGNVLWENDIMKGSKDIKGPDGKKDEIENIFNNHVMVIEDEEDPELSDFAIIKFNDYISDKNFAVINIHTGEEVISPAKAGMPVVQALGKEMATFNYNGSGYIPKLKAAIISGAWEDRSIKEDPDQELTKIVDLPSGEIRWETDQVAVDAMPVVGHDGNLVMAGKFKIAKLNAATGDIMWEFNVEEKKQMFLSFDISLDLKAGYFFERKKNSGQLTALDLEGGKRIWSQEMKLKEVPQMFAIRDGVVVVDEKWLTLYDLNTGSEKWKAKKATGIVVDLGSHGLAVAARGTRLMLLDRNTGEAKWDERVKGIGIDKIIAKGIMYTDDKNRLGLITYDGEKVWDKKGMIPSPTVRYRPEFTRELIYADGDLYDVELETGDYSILKSKIDKEFKEDEVPTSIEEMEGGYLLSSASNLMMLEKDGSVRWHKYWDVPEMSLAAKIAIRTLQAVAYAAAAANQAAANSNSYYGNSWESKMYQDQADSWSNAAAQGGEEARKKFTSTKSKGHLQVILAIVGKGGQKAGSGFVKVDKRNGEELASIQIGDKEPIYDFDPISGQVFYKSDKKEIISYDF